jgi:acyl-CoA synthetase (AMP-forming)/AMP-acid ligase II
VETFFGALLAGAVPVPLYPPVRLGRIAEYHAATARMLTAAGARLVVTDRRVGLLLGESVARARPPLGRVYASELLEEGPPLEREVSPEDLGLIQFSSGSTTDPKPVALTHANLVAQCATLQQLMRDPGGPPPLGVSWLPLYHDMGLIGCLLVAAYWPGPLVLIPPEVFLARPAIWLRAISRHRGTISPAPNFAYGLCLKRVREEDTVGLDLSSWRFALNGAEPVSPEVITRFCDRFAPLGFDPASLMPVYGLSEASLAVTFSPRRAPLRRAEIDPERLAREGRAVTGARLIVSVGKPVPGVELELRDELGKVVPEDRVGRVFARGRP